jgi:8-oxo-dGTP pyrophosphatase MutT (NUDIX family)
VSYFALVDAGHVLLVDHRNAQLWLPTGGHVDPGEHPRETVRRELREELGLEIDGDLSPPLMLTVTGTVGVTAGHVDVSLWYVVESDMRSQFIWDRGEFSDVRWFGFDDVPLGRSDPHMGRFIAKLMNLNL